MGQLHDRIAALSRRIDERINLKQAHRRLQLVAKVLIVTTFFEDALRAVFTFQIQKDSMRLAGWRNSWLHVLLPIFSFMVQTMGAALVALPTTRRLHVLNEAGCYVLMCWCAFHPFMYGQQTNWEFVLQTLTIMGGLAILLSHTMLMGLGRHAAMLLPAKAVSPAVAAAGASGGVAERAHAIQAAGRVLIVAIFLHYATGHCKGFTRRALREMQAHDWVHPVAEGLLIVGLLGMCALVIIGIKSRWVALLLAVLMSFYSCWRHPFWIYAFSQKTYRIEGVAHMEGYEVDAFTMGDHQRYFFFQAMSTVGALLLLVVHGPGRLSMDEQGGGLVLITTHDA